MVCVYCLRKFLCLFPHDILCISVKTYHVYTKLYYFTNWYIMADFQTFKCRYSFGIDDYAKNGGPEGGLTFM